MSLYGDGLLGNSTNAPDTQRTVEPSFRVTKEQWDEMVARVKRVSDTIDVLTKNGADLTRAFNQASRGERPVGYWEES